MDFGVGSFPTHDGIGPGPLARMPEDAGEHVAPRGPVKRALDRWEDDVAQVNGE